MLKIVTFGWLLYIYTYKLTFTFEDKVKASY